VPVRRKFDTAPLDMDPVDRKSTPAGLGEQLSDDALGPFTVPFAEMVVADVATRIGYVERRPVPVGDAFQTA